MAYPGLRDLAVHQYGICAKYGPRRIMLYGAWSSCPESCNFIVNVVYYSMKITNCQWCNEPLHFRNIKFCNVLCSVNFRWEFVTKPKIEAGQVVDYRPLKKYLIEKFGEQCFECGQLPIWNNKPLTLQLDHIDGDSDNSLPSNIRLLCPHCHSQTDTFGSKGKGSRYKKATKRNTYLQDYKARLV